MLFCMDFALVHIDQVAHGLEKIKGYTGREQNGKRDRLQ